MTEGERAIGDEHRDTLLAAYRGIMVLRTMCKAAGLDAGRETSEQVLVDLAKIMPELPALSALRAPDKKGQTS